MCVGGGTLVVPKSRVGPFQGISQFLIVWFVCGCVGLLFILLGLCSGVCTFLLLSVKTLADL